ncbi:integration host factor subunit beta [Hydrogenivirga caldilitoris]|uniref:Integration host factor subunit beta n=1 Tax=Hydrogenivirga caldilitoris TaxID=246264 RepID=A0A497XNU7_9AQUI|nr:HU family DNA-binding protein [Hydrogenivirga caldilitoris]RLJ69931.1 integration host factor subunit beta [Hydrogenivirga caldilitoris]
MKKSDITREIAAKRGMSQRKARLIVDQVFQVMAEALVRGEKVEIRGLGTFKIKKKPSRFVKDPRTGVEIFVKEKFVPTFKMGKLIKNHLNSEDK